MLKTLTAQKQSSLFATFFFVLSVVTSFAFSIFIFQPVALSQKTTVAIEHAELALALPDPGVLAEDIDYDPQSDTFLVTSVLEKKIIRLSRQGKASDFAEAPSHWPMLAIKVDAAHKLGWATEVALDGFAIVPKSEWRRSAVLCFDLVSGRLLKRIEGPTGSALGDMVLTREGVPIVSDGAGGGVYRVRGGKLERIDKGDFKSPQTAAIDSAGHILFVPDYSRGIGMIDVGGGGAAWLKGHNGNYALNGIDGLYLRGDWLIATQNGTSPERVIRFRLDRSHQTVISQEIIEQATATLGDPTHGVIVGDYFYYIANSGWDVLDDQGNVKPGSKLTPARIMRFDLRGKSQHK